MSGVRRGDNLSPTSSKASAASPPNHLKSAFEQSEIADFKWFGGEAALAFEEVGDFACSAPFPARERDVRVERAAFRLEADGDARALDLRGEGGEGRLRFDPGPQRARVALLEAAHARDADSEELG